MPDWPRPRNRCRGGCTWREQPPRLRRVGHGRNQGREPDRRGHHHCADSTAGTDKGPGLRAGDSQVCHCCRRSLITLWPLHRPRIPPQPRVSALRSRTCESSGSASKKRSALIKGGHGNNPILIQSKRTRLINEVVPDSHFASGLDRPSNSCSSSRADSSAARANPECLGENGEGWVETIRHFGRSALSDPQ